MNLFFIFGDVLFGKVNKKFIINKIEKKIVNYNIEKLETKHENVISV